MATLSMRIDDQIVTWRDKKRYFWPLSLVVPLLPFMGWAGVELGHKKDKLERWLAKVVLAQTAYGHFEIEHNRGHHARVSTPEDPASAPR